MAPQAQQSQGNEGSLDFLWLIVLVIATILLVWYFGKSYISSAILFVKLYEIYAIQFVLGFWNKFVTFLHLPTVNMDVLNNLVGVIQKPLMTANFETLASVSAQVGKFTRYPFMLILLLLAFDLYFGSISSQFKNVFDMERLKQTEAHNWPRISPVLKLKLVDQDVNEGAWAMAMTPMQFCKKHKLLKEETKDGKPAVSLIKGLAHNVFVLQLGPLWQGNLEALPEHAKALLAVFAARVMGDADASDILLDQLAVSAAAGSLNSSGTMELLKKHINAKPIVKVLSRHAYVTTMMASMLDLARGAGVLASSEFIWLKPLDRRLWYVLSNVGRQTAAAEIAGVFAHWLVEVKLRYPMKTPMVDSAVSGLAEEIAEVLYEPEEED